MHRQIVFDECKYAMNEVCNPLCASVLVEENVNIFH